jgi:penicillin amidase
MAYADRAGNIALWGQGQFVNKWKGQGKFIMNGWDSATLWKELIPMTENPHVLNPAQGYVSSANQCVTDSTYPYWYNGHFAELRSWRINQVLGSLQKATVQDMFGLQNDVYSVLASRSLPVLLRYVQQDNGVAAKYKKYIDLLSNWDDKLGAESVAATLYQRWWTIFQKDIWSGLKGIPEDLKPLNERTMQLIQMDSLVDYTIGGKPFRDAVKETAVRSFTAMAEAYDKDANGKDILWYMDKNTTVAHLTKLPAFSYDHLKIGGWGNTVNATRSDHGPSWRMVVQMGTEIEAYATYPGGQSGNPGSQYYNGFLDHWVEGQYYKLQFLPNAPQQDNKNIRYTWNVSVKK